MDNFENDSFQELPVQTRSEENGLRAFTTLKVALKESEIDLTIWKISFTFNGDRVILERTDDNTWTLRQ